MRSTPSEPQGPSATTRVVQPAGDGVQVSMVLYPRPERAAKLWTQWGQGLVLPDGRFVSAMGDHEGADGNSYLFVYDPATQRITRIGDVLSRTDHVPGGWGFGKVHGQIVAGRCGEAYIATYWGTRADMEYTSTYRGDVLFRLDPVTLELQELGAPLEKHGIPSLAGSRRLGLVYGEAADPTPPTDLGREQGAFFVYDTERERVIFRSDDVDHTLFRNVMVDAAGRAYVAREDGRLLMYEPGADRLVALDAKLPHAGMLRASTRPAADGTVYGVTQPLGQVENPRFELFALHTRARGPRSRTRPRLHGVARARPRTRALLLRARRSR